MIDIPDENIASNTSERQDPRLGIAIGVLLSIVCIVICMLIIVRHRRCLKSPRQHANLNGDITRDSFQNRNTTDRSTLTGTTTLLSSSSAPISVNCTIDTHEMQTLIIRTSNENVTSINGNGLSKKHVNGGISSNGRNNENINSDDENENDLSQYSLISSTPKTKHKTVVECTNHTKNSSTNNIALATTTTPTRFTATDSIENSSYNTECNRLVNEIEKATNILTNGSLKEQQTTILPQTNSPHSISTTSPIPTITKSLDEKKKKAKKRTTSIPSIFDDSQQSLLPNINTNENSSNSSCSNNTETSCSSSTIPMHQIDENNHNCDTIHANNYLMNVNDSNNIVALHSTENNSSMNHCETNDKITSINDDDSIVVDINDDSQYQKRLPKWDFRRPIIGPNG